MSDLPLPAAVTRASGAPLPPRGGGMGWGGLARWTTPIVALVPSAAIAECLGPNCYDGLALFLIAAAAALLFFVLTIVFFFLRWGRATAISAVLFIVLIFVLLWVDG